MLFRRVFGPLLVSLWLLLPGAGHARYADDWRGWNELMLRQYQGDRWQTYSWAELRHVDDLSRLGTWLVQQKLLYRAEPWLSLGIGGAWIEIQGAGGAWTTLARMEYEVTPSWKLSETDSIQFRNRLETRWWENRDWTWEYLTRHRVRYSHKAKWFASMNRIEMSNEFFYDYRLGKYNENRFRLFDLHLDAAPRTTLNGFFLIRSRRVGGTGDWEHAYIIGLGFRYTFAR